MCLNNSSEQGRPRRDGEGWRRLGRSQELFSAFWESPGLCPRSPWVPLPASFWRLWGEKAAQGHRDILALPIHWKKKTGIKHLAAHRSAGFAEKQKDQGWMQEQFPQPEHFNSAQRGFSHPSSHLCVSASACALFLRFKGIL